MLQAPGAINPTALALSTGTDGHTPLIATKLHPPRLQTPLVVRERLLALLDRGLGASLTLVRAPAGFGKTTLVNQWLASHAARSEPLQVAWVSLDPDDNDPIRFVRYILAACRMLWADAEPPEPLELDVMRLPLDAPISLQPALTTLLNGLAHLPSPGILVLEDYHVISEPLIHEALAFLLDHLPSSMHLLLISRSAPPLPLAQLHAHGNLNELQAPDLRFSHDETRAFLAQALPFQLESETVDQVEARIEGWVAGLRLTTLALGRHADPLQVGRQLDALIGSQQHIMAYLCSDVLAMQPEPIQDFLLQTSILRRLNGPLCDAVTGHDNSAELLASLERANMFVELLDATAQWYRYHALFAEECAMRPPAVSASSACEPTTTARVSGMRPNGLTSDAIDAALLAGTYERAAALLEPSVVSQIAFELHEPHTLRRRLEQLPQAVMRLHPALCFGYAIVLLRTSNRPIAERLAPLIAPLLLAETGWRREENTVRLGEVYGLRALCAFWDGKMDGAVYWSHQALDMLPETDIAWRGIALGFVGHDQLRLGQFTAARQILADARERTAASGNGPGTRAHTLLLGEVCAGQGELQLAAALFGQVFVEHDNDRFDHASAALGLAGLAYEWNDLDGAVQDASMALEIGTELDSDSLQIGASIVLARAAYARGSADEAQRRLTALLARLQPARSPELYRLVLLWQARLHLMAGSLPGVQRWLRMRGQYAAGRSPLELEQEQLLESRLLIAQGDGSAARSLLKHTQEHASSAGRVCVALEAQVLLALAAAADEHTDQANQALRQALADASADGYRRLFLDEGEPLARCLRTLMPTLREQPLRAYAQELVQALVLERARQAPSIDLSPQEQRVLGLLATGHSNSEIAKEFVVSVNTVKTQLKSIYRKLNVTSRRDACAMARQLNLI